MTFSSLSRPRIAAHVMRGFVLALVCIGSSAAVLAQDAHRLAMSHTVRALGGGGGLNVLSRPAAPFYDVVALRVEFQPDTSRFTTGDGTFSDDLYRGLEVSIDPLPHDAGYFQAHLDFLSHYVERVSDGRTVVNTHLVPELVRVSMPMAAYSPIGENSDSDAELGKLAALVRESWALASAQSSFDLSGFDPETTAFVLFHAGAGRDIELTGSSLDRTPQDLPSLFFDAASLSRLSPGSPITFNGFEVPSTLLIPETESRLGRDFIADQDFVAEFSINGFLAASFFSYLGVPDLFNAETGESAIGPFGLMDPLGIFAYNGLFPPEPSAWTKQFLGWNNPVEVSPGTDPQEISLDAVAEMGFSDAARVPISGAEYFLVENRQRASTSTELVLSIYRNGENVEQRIQLDTQEFDRFNVNAFEGGVVVGAEPYDWALPGVADLGERYDGGIVIWHIDERVLREGIATNRVNSDPARRAVDVEEADSGQDIGFGNSGVALGTPFDFWYEGNPATAITASGAQVQLYENRFGADTYPSSNSAEGGPSFVELANFSASGATMTMSVAAAQAENVELLTPFARSNVGENVPAGGSVKFFTSASGDFLTVHIPDTPGVGMLFVDPDSGSVDQGLFGPFTTPVSSTVVNYPGLPSSVRNLPSGQDEVVSGGGIVVQFPAPSPFDDGEYRGPTMAMEDSYLCVVENETESAVMKVNARLGGDDRVELVPIDGVTEPRALSFGTDSTLAVVGTTASRVDGMSWTYPNIGRDIGSPVFGTDALGLIGVFARPESGILQWLLPDLTVEETYLFDRYPGVQTTDHISSYPVLVDLDEDGTLDALIAIGTQLFGLTRSGAVVEGFPIQLPSDVLGQPLVARLTNSGRFSVVVGAANGSLYAYDLGGNGQLVSGFPLSVSGRIEATPLIHNDILYAVATDGSIRAWRFTSPVEVWWGQLHKDNRNTSYVHLDAEVSSTGAAGLLDDAETYNWPNPVRDGRTFLRFRTDEDADVAITIVDLAGAFVEELDAGSVRGGVPTELEWSTSVPSGVYFARVTATTASGREDSQLIRMAVIR